MAKNQLFQEMDLSHKPKRNGYDLSHPVNFTAKAGELLPVVHFSVNPFEKVKMKINHFTRTSPIETAAQTRIKEYFDVFFVPYRLLYKDSPQILTQNAANPTYATSPTSNKQIGAQLPQFDFFSNNSNSYLGTNGILEKLCRYQNSHGFNRGAMSAKLINHLRYCYISKNDIEHFLNQDASDITTDWYHGERYLSMFPLLAYQCIYYNFFRNTQWENNVPYNYNVDYLGSSSLYTVDASNASSWVNFWRNPTPFDLQYVNYPKDLFFGMFPDAQLGDVSEVQVNGVSLASDDFVIESTIRGDNGLIKTEGGMLYESNSGRPFTGDLVADLDFAGAESNLEGHFNIIQLRQAQFLQKYKEIIGSGRQDYRARIEKIYGGDVSDFLAQVPIYIDGKSSDIKISEIDNTNLSDSEAIQRGKGTGAASSDIIEFEVPGEHGLIMVLYHSAPEITYSLNAHHFDVVRTEVDDFLNPVFDQLGFEELPSYFLDLTLANNSNTGHTIGYTTRYYDYKTMLGTVLGDLRETRSNYLTPVNFNYLDDYIVNGNLVVNANFFRVNPSILDPIFALKANPKDYDRWQAIDNGDSRDVWTEADLPTTDQLMIFANFDVHLIRPIDYNGVPY